jgi:hypothetical protein
VTREQTQVAVVPDRIGVSRPVVCDALWSCILILQHGSACDASHAGSV